MRLLIILMTIYVSTANAGMYKCKDENGKTTYSQTQCRFDNGTMEKVNIEDKQPAITHEARLMRLKNDIAMRVKI